MSDAARPVDLTGQEMAGCRVIRKLGAGAMGTVYLAEQLNLQRQVALKVLDAKFSRDVTYIERFEREAQAAARLVHFNVVQVYDFGRVGEIYYIISELVDGNNVQDLIDEQSSLAPERAADLVLQAARGLSAAEDAGIVHRDIKPENLMLTKSGVVKIADFGLAKVVQDDAAVTQSGMILGTPFYMSPEQARGMTLDPRSDLYSLGVTFYHMLTGQIPFDGDSVISVLLKHISAERPDPAEINPAVPEIVSEVVMRLMHREPDKRYTSAHDLVRDVETLIRRLQSGDLGEEETAAPASGSGTSVDSERLKRYKRLRRESVSHLVARPANAAAVNRMKERCKSDAGVFVEGEEIFPADTIVEMRFTVPGRENEVQGLGLVRFTLENGPRSGMGVTFLKMQEVKPAVQERPETIALQHRKHFSPKEIVEELSRTPLQSRLLKYYYANSGRTVSIQQIAGALGVGARMLIGALEAYYALGFASQKSGNRVAFLWPEDHDLQNAIIDWMQQYGLS